jgi:hypothetical protein
MTTQTSLLRLILPVQGEFSGTWGDQVNAGLTNLLDTAIAGTTTLSTDADVTLTTANYASDQARAMVLLCSGARTAIRNITAPASSKVYVVVNSTTGGFGVVLRGAGPTTGITIPSGAVAVAVWNGSDFAFAAASTNSPTFTGTPRAPTAAVSATGTQLATLDYVLGQAATVVPLVAGTAAVGTSVTFARQDHVHPVQTTVTTATNQSGGTINATSGSVSGAFTFSTQPSIPQWFALQSAQSASGIATGFTGVPSWVKRITIQLAGISTNGTSDLVIRFGNGSYYTSGYVGGTMTAAIGSTNGTGWSTGALFTHSTGVVASAVFNGTVTLTLENASSNLWVINGTLGRSDNNANYLLSGYLTLSGALDRVQIATTNGSDVFDAGQMNVIYEG